MHTAALARRLERPAAAASLAAALLIGTALPLASEKLVMTATYPAPLGVYNQLITTGNAGAVAADTVLSRNAGNTLIATANQLGKLGVGIAAPQARLDVAGDIRARGLVLLSDRRLKRDIAPLAGSLDRLASIGGVSFTWRGGGRDLGVLAQDVRKVYPELVSADSQDGTLSVRYPALLGPVVSALSELRGRWRDQNARLARLESENRVLRDRLAALERAAGR